MESCPSNPEEHPGDSLAAVVAGDLPAHSAQSRCGIGQGCSGPRRFRENVSICDKCPYDDLSNAEVLEQTLAVNFYGLLNVTNSFLPLLKQAKGAIINNLSLAGLAALPMIPSYSLSKAAAFNVTQSLRALLAGQVTVHAVVLGPIDTDMNRGFNIPKASTESAAKGIFDGLENGEEEVFPDPTSQSIAEGWRNGVLKALEHQFAAFAPKAAQAA